MNISILRFICVLQFILAGCMILLSFVDIFEYRGWYGILRFAALGFVIWWAVFVLQLIQTNYPDEPIAGGRKTAFNWLYLVNFFVLPVILGRVISNVTILYDIQKNYSGRISAYFYGITAIYLCMAILQVMILYGAFTLRRKLNENFARKIDNMDLMKG